jgi:hypothetical protein
MGLTLQLRTSLMAVRALRKKLGIAPMSKLLWRVLRRERRGEPWEDLDAPASDDERACRAQAGRVILLYDELSDRIGRDEALELLRSIVSEGGVYALRDALPRLNRAELEAMPAEAQDAFLRDVLGRFPNATIGEVELARDRFRYEITRCEFVQLCRRVGRPQLASLFCSGDGLYFERYLTEVHFERPQTLADGDTCCDFRFRWKEGA